MHTLYGIWVDHAHCFIVKANKAGEMTIQEISSGVEAHHHGGVQGDEHLSLVNQGSHDERRKNQMKTFSKEIIRVIHDADEFLVFGPGNAKHEFKHELEREKALVKKCKGYETTDKMTVSELKEYMKNYFKLPQ